MTVSIQGLSKAAVFAALYNAAKPQGAGFIHYDPTPMSVEEAQRILDSRGANFDYYKGRVMKIDLSGDEVEEWGFDRDNGAGAVAETIAALRRNVADVNPEEAEHRHLENTRNAAILVDEHIYDPTTDRKGDRSLRVNLGLQDLAPHMKDKIDRILRKKVDTDESE